MAMPIVALVCDEQSIRHPELLGLTGENLASQRWLALLTSAEDARAYLARDASVQEVWVAACGPIAPINLAATIKRDRAGRRVCMLSAQESGSLLSRSSAAGIDASLSPQAFIERYAQCKHLAMQGAFGGQASAAGVGAGAGASTGAGVGAGVASPLAGGAVSAAGVSGGRVGGQVSVAGAPGSLVSPSAPSATGISGQASSAAMPPVTSGATPAANPYAALQPDKTVSLSGAPARNQTASPSLYSQPNQARTQTTALAQTSSTNNARSGLLIPVVSASGGCGKSAVALLSAYILQAAGFNTLLLDFDLQFGDMAELMGVERPLRIDEVLTAPARLDSLKSEGNAPALLAAPAHVDAAEAVIEQAADLIDGLRTRFDVIVANTGSAWAEQHAVLLERSSKVLFLVDQRRTSIRATRRALDLCGRCGIAVNPFVFALNGCGKGAPLTSIDVSCALKGSEVRELRDGGPDVEDLLAAGAPFELVDYGNDFCESLRVVLADMLPAEVAQRLQAGGESSSASSLFRPRKSRRRKRG